MNAYGVDILHTADGYCMVVGVTHNLKLYLFIALNALLDKNLMNGRKLECVYTYLDKLLLIVCKSAAGVFASMISSSVKPIPIFADTRAIG